MFNPAILKKKKSALQEVRDSEPMMVGKKVMNHAMDSMAPEMEDEDEDEEEKKPKKLKMGPEAKIEIELMLNGAKKKK